VTRPMSAEDLASLVQDARLFQSELERFSACERADAQSDPKKAEEMRRRIVKEGFIYPTERASAAEIGLLYANCREVARIALARRSADFRARYGIVLTCGDPPADGG